MLATTVRLQCRLGRQGLCRTRSALLRPCPPSLRNRTQIRIFTAGRNLLKQQNGEQTAADKLSEERATVSASETSPKTVELGTPAQKTSSTDNAKAKIEKSDPLAEPTISRTAQRKVDWAIMKEMAQYLWPKVRYLEPISQASLLTGGSY